MKIAYVFTSGRKKRLEKIENGEPVPREFLFGLTELREMGHSVDIFELIDFSDGKNNFVKKILKKRNAFLANFTGLSSSSHLISSEKLEVLNQYDVVIANNEYVAFGLAYYKKKGAFSTSLVFFVMGMASKIQIGKERRGKFFFDIRYFLGKKEYLELINESSKIIFVGKGEYNLANTIFNEQNKKFEFIPFPVDTEFWKPSNEHTDEYVLFIGNDRQRNFELLKRIAFLTPEIHYIFVTQQIDRCEVTDNVEVIRGDWKEELLSDEEIRELIRKSALVILPLIETYQPSGQSVCHQSMACGKTVMISETMGFWAPDTLITNKHLILIRETDPDLWVEQIQKILSDKRVNQKIGHNAFVVMNTDYSLKNCAITLDQCLEAVGANK